MQEIMLSFFCAAPGLERDSQEVLSIPGLTDLSLAGNRISFLPDDIGNLRQVLSRLLSLLPRNILLLLSEEGVLLFAVVFYFLAAAEDGIGRE